MNVLIAPTQPSMSITLPMRALMNASTPAKSRLRPTWRPAATRCQRAQPELLHACSSQLAEGAGWWRRPGARQVVLAALAEEHVGLDDQVRGLEPRVDVQQLYKAGVGAHLRPALRLSAACGTAETRQSQHLCGRTCATLSGSSVPFKRFRCAFSRRLESYSLIFLRAMAARQPLRSAWQQQNAEASYSLTQQSLFMNSTISMHQRVIRCCSSPTSAAPCASCLPAF